jgi:hypothetical protein
LSLPYWIADTLTGTPAALWIMVGVGLPWALALLPRRDWRFRIEAITLGVFVGTAWLTVWMFVLGTLGAARQQALLTRDLVLLGTALLAAVGVAIVWLRARRRPHPGPAARSPLEWDERLLLVLIGVALLVRWLVIAYWPFTAYDALWVYGYQGRLYALEGFIPQSIGYYPPYLSLQYAFQQIVSGGLNDHIARAGLWFLHAASIGAVFVLGRRLFDRRIGIIAAAIWALYPHVGEWSRAGDLEMLQAALFTLASAYVLTGWTGQGQRRWYAALGGLILGIGLWTKPTMGAFVWGLALLVVIDLVRVRFNIRSAWQRGQLALIALMTAAPLGGLWYIRNLLLGHPAIDFPPDFWLTQAARSGAEFGWLLVALGVYLALVLFGPLPRRPRVLPVVVGASLVLAGVLPSILNPQRMGALEWTLLASGAAVLAVTLGRHARAVWTGPLRRDAARLGWAAALALPYFVTWFVSYSYHYRLSFAIVPLLILPTAVILGRWSATWALSRLRRWLVAAALIALAAPGVVAAVYDINAGWDYLFTDALPDDHARVASGNQSLLRVVHGLQIWLDEHPGETLTVVAPGILRLPFFFPEQDIRVNQAPIRLDELDGVTYFIYGVPETTGAYEDVPPQANAVFGALGRHDLSRLAWGEDDGLFRYDVYELALDNRFEAPFINAPAAGDVIIGDAVRFLGLDVGGLEFWPGRRMILHLFWEPLAPTALDYSIFVHLVCPDSGLVATWDGPIARSELGWYSTRIWEPGEVISDERVIALPEGAPARAQGCEMIIGLYDPLTNQRLPITVDGVPVGDQLSIENRFQLLPAQP